MMKNKPRALYIHIPFCNHICGYCDFCRMIYTSKIADKYLDGLQNELSSYQIEEIDTIYVGGGTPTSLNLNQLERLLCMIDPYYRDGIEYTFESNVETLNKEKLLLLKKHHVNRLSLGVQSTNDEILKYVGRHHTYKDVKDSYYLCRELGFNNISFDLILGLPMSSLEQEKANIKNIIALNPEHISTYSLKVLPGTMFNKNKIEEMDDDLIRDMYDMVNDELNKAGFIHYEVSNFAKPGYQSKHNYVYWDDKQYYGIGLGASGYIGNKRYVNTRSIKDYLNDETRIDSYELVDQKDDLTYYFMLKLRTITGINLVDFQYKFNTNLLLKCPKTIEKYVNDNLLALENGVLRPTHSGMMVLDMILLDLMQEYESSSN